VCGGPWRAAPGNWRMARAEAPASVPAEKAALILVNLGTPTAPTPAAVRAFLRPFLSDRRVIDLPRWFWLPLLHLLVLPLRPHRTARNYAAIWEAEGAPLRTISVRQARALEKLLRAEDLALCVRQAATYGRPSLEEAVWEAASLGARRFLVAPMYPQYSDATTGAVVDRLRALRCKNPELRLQLLPEHYAHPLYIEALAQQLRRHWQQHGRARRLLLSFHGLPQKRVDRGGDPYAYQCRHTLMRLAEALDLDGDEYRLCFQSRFGFAPWLAPSTDETLRAWGAAGLESVDVFCPGFAADCLETLEEIAIRGRQTFAQAGGGEYRFVPCLNDNPGYLQCLAAMARRALSSAV